MTKHDEARRTKTVNALLKAKEYAELERLYLSVQEPAPMDELYRVHDVLDHVTDALDRLTVAEEVST